MERWIHGWIETVFMCWFQCKPWVRQKGLVNVGLPTPMFWCVCVGCCLVVLTVHVLFKATILFFYRFLFCACAI